MNYHLPSYIQQKRCTLLGVGPMSLNCVNACLNIVSTYDFPLLLIASRNQIDSLFHGGGYVNNWTTQEFAAYVKKYDKKNNIILCRDHGGPWQNKQEVSKKLSFNDALQSAKDSFVTDIDCGFDILHIDPSIDIHQDLSQNLIIDRVCELYSFCSEYAARNNRQIYFEVGTEEQSGSTNATNELDNSITTIQNFCSHNGYTMPTFVVIQNGTKVVEMRNVGSLDSPIRVANEIPPEIQLSRLLSVCNNRSILYESSQHRLLIR